MKGKKGIDMSKKKDVDENLTSSVEENESLKYEKMYERLQKIVDSIAEKDSMDLDKVVSSIEEGYKLIEAMKTRLAQAKDKVEMIKKLNVSDSEQEENDGDETPF